MPSTTTSFHDGQWHFVVGVADTSSKECRIYVDGVAQALTNTGQNLREAEKWGQASILDKSR